MKTKVEKKQRLVLKDAASLGTELIAETGGDEKWGDCVEIVVAHRTDCCTPHRILLDRETFAKLVKLKPSRWP